MVPGASGRVAEPGEVRGAAGAGEPRQEELIPVLLGRTLATSLPALLKAAMDSPDVTVSAVCGGTLVLAMAGLLLGLVFTAAVQAAPLQAQVVKTAWGWPPLPFAT